ncbi:hypothetical protein PV11_03893 [Exophiala sideris]|uniref:Flavoprotein oxygenase n=1 Tax=Exophiala sideris TaxID=1016849 RepID=A0A0D1VZ70_9EURO|nr:hypothetical protein PV11_03893 [Exophiala sideris]
MSDSSPVINVDGLAFQQSSPLSLRQEPLLRSPRTSASYLREPSQCYDYNFSSVDNEENTTDAEADGHAAISQEEEDSTDDPRRISGCSSISSFPASVIQHQPPSRQSQYGSPRTPTKRDSLESYTSPGYGGHDHAVASSRGAREYRSVFRHPSSVKALQMNDEVMSDTQSVLRHRRSESVMSSYSHRSLHSAHTSPTKRSSRSQRTSSSKPSSNLRKEFPLVLLHCTLLPPTLLSQSTAHEDSLIQELLPEDYKKRWTTLHNKLVEDVEVRTRGILIPHPKEDYELLEERLLESLDLEIPRIRHNHYYPSDANSADSGFESGSVTEEEAEVEGSKCPDCGRRVPPGAESRKWEVKVFAANGLMRAGAWSAAWQEMEKVDVEVKVWLPEEVRRDLEAKLALINTSAPSEPRGSDLDQEPYEPEIQYSRDREVYGDVNRHRSQSEIDGFAESPRQHSDPFQATPQKMIVEKELASLVLIYVQRFSHNSKNFLIGLLSCLILFLALRGSEPSGKGKAASYEPVLAASTEVSTTTIFSTSIDISTSTVTVPMSTQSSFVSPVSEGPASLISSLVENVERQLRGTTATATTTPATQDSVLTEDNSAGLSESVVGEDVTQS